MAETLTICIPSFDRFDKAAQTAAALLRQSEGRDCEILVLDNCSEADYRTAFAKAGSFDKALATGRLKVVRNKTNVGMSANFMKCFEAAGGEWIWLVSDDDEILPDALENIFAAIGRHGHSNGLIKFSSDRSRPEGEDKTLLSFEAFVDSAGNSVDDFNGWIFISNSLFKLADFLPLLRTGYEHSHSFVPHFMMMAAYMNGGGCAAVVRDQLVDYVVPEAGYSYSLVAGLGVGSFKSLLHGLDDKRARKFYAMFFPHNDFKVLIDLHYLCRAKAGPSAYRYFSATYLGSVKLARSFSCRCLLHVFAWFGRFEIAFDFLANHVLQRLPKYRRHIEEIKARYRNSEY